MGTGSTETSAKAVLSVHHIGGRFGTGGIPFLPAFERDMVRVYYDADRDCINQIREKLGQTEAELHVLPYCIGGREGRGKLHINYDTTASSLYPLNAAYAPYYFFSYNHDFVAGDSLKTMEEREVEVLTLDELAEIRTGVVPPPDFISMDVQGAEYPILEGCSGLLERNVLGLVIETAIHPLYEGQRLFDEVRQLLARAGFHFVKFLQFHDYAPHRAPVGLRGEGFHMLADALFLRQIESVKRSNPESVGNDMLGKLAFFSIVFGQFEYAVKCLGEMTDHKILVSIPGGGRVYNRFLNELLDGMRSMPVKFPPVFSEKYSFELSRKRFAGKSQVSSDAGGAGLAEKLWLRYIYPNIYLLAGVYRFLVNTLWASLAALIMFDSPVEKTLKKYGLAGLAGLLKKRRVVESFFCR